MDDECEDPVVAEYQYLADTVIDSNQGDREREAVIALEGFEAYWAIDWPEDLFLDKF
jgi:hypothetical protein